MNLNLIEFNCDQIDLEKILIQWTNIRFTIKTMITFKSIS